MIADTQTRGLGIVSCRYMLILTHMMLITV
jgi:hypothetical protein